MHVVLAIAGRHNSGNGIGACRGIEGNKKKSDDWGFLTPASSIAPLFNRFPCLLASEKEDGWARVLFRSVKLTTLFFLVSDRWLRLHKGSEQTCWSIRISFVHAPQTLLLRPRPEQASLPESTRNAPPAGVPGWHTWCEWYTKGYTYIYGVCPSAWSSTAATNSVYLRRPQHRQGLLAPTQAVSPALDLRGWCSE